jgi:hypothetical protein
MATPRFNKVALLFMEMINDPTSESVGVVLGGKQLLTTAKIEGFVNRAMLKFFSDTLLQTQGNLESYGKVFPELIKVMTPITSAGGLYTLAANYLDYFNVVGSGLRTPDSKIIRFIDESLTNELLAGTIEEFTPAADNLFFYENAGSFTFLPASEFNAIALSIFYLAKPVDFATGNPFTSGGTNDIQYKDHWVTQIAEIAKELYEQTIGER